jgi:hypothetical protein
MPDLLLELRSEEIPARMQRKAAGDLKKMVTDGLVDAGLTYEAATEYWTPRRLALDIRGVTARSKDVREERKGPKVGAPEQAVQGFLRAAGLASIEEAQVQSDPKKGDFYVAGSGVTREPGAEIGGEETSLSAQELGLAQRRSALNVAWQVVSTTLILGLLAALSVRLMPALTLRLARTSTQYPVMSGALGVLILLVFPILLVFMAFTIILIPVTVIGGLILALLVGYGVIGLGRGIGERVSGWRSWPLSPPVSAAIGTGSIALVLNLIALVPFAAEVPLALVGAVATGSVVLSGFGTRNYEPPEYEKGMENDLASTRP